MTHFNDLLKNLKKLRIYHLKAMNKVSDFLKNIKEEPTESIVEVISYYGEKVLDEPEALDSEVAQILMKHLPYSYPYIKKIVLDKNLLSVYSDFLKKEAIDDIEISNLLVSKDLLSFEKMSDDLIELVFSVELSENLVEKYLKIFKNKDVLSLLVDPFKTNLSRQYFLLCKETRLKDLMRSKIGIKYLSVDDKIDFFVLKLSEGISDQLSLSFIQTKEQFKSLVSKVKKSDLSFFSYEVLKDSFYLEDSVLKESVVDLLKNLRDEQISVLLEYKGLQLRLIIDGLLELKKAIPFTEENILNMDFLVEDKYPDYLSIKFLNEIIKQKPDSFDQYLSKLINQPNVEKSKLVLYEFKNYIEENKIFFKDYNKPEFKGIIDYNPAEVKSINTKEDLDQISDFSTIEILPFLKGELFENASEKVKTYLSRFLEDVPSFDINQQQVLFDKILNFERITYFKYFDKLDHSFLNKSLETWISDPYQSFSIDNGDTLKYILDTYSDKLNHDHLSKILNSISNQAVIDKSIIKKIFDLLSEDSSEIYLNKVMRVSGVKLVEKNLLPESLFMKACFENLHNQRFWIKVLKNDYYFSLVPKIFYKNIECSLSLTDFSDLDKVISIIQESENNILFKSVSNEFLSYFYKNNIFFKKQKFVGSLNSLESESLSYALNYIDENEFPRLLKNVRFNLSNVDILFPKIKEILKADKEALSEFASVGILSSNLDVKMYSQNVIFNDLNEYSLEVILKQDLFDNSLGPKIIDFYNKNEPNHLVQKVLNRLFSTNQYSIEDAVINATNPDLFDSLYYSVKNISQLERKYIRYLRKHNKKEFVPSDYFVALDLLEENKPSKFYHENFDESLLKIMNESQKKQFKENIENSLSENFGHVNPSIFNNFSFDMRYLKFVYMNYNSSNTKYDLLNFVSTCLESENKEMIIEIIKENPEKLETINREMTDLSISLYNLGVKNIFSLKIEVDITDLSLVNLLNETLDPFLLKEYIKNWKTVNFLSNFSKEVEMELSKTVKETDVFMDRISFEKGIVNFEIKGICLVKFKEDKKTGKFIFIDGYRKDLFPKVKNLYKKINSERPDKISGFIDIESKKFIPNDDSLKFEFEINKEDLEKIEYMKSLDVEGSLKAIAKRGYDFNYSVDILFEQSLEIGSKQIEKEVRKKSFDINKKLEDLLKVSPKRQFGFELELGVFGLDRKSVASFLKKKGFKTNVSFSYGKSEGKVWDFKEDTSLNEDGLESYNEDTETYTKDGDVFEIASPILKGKEGINEAKRFLNSLFDRFEVVSGDQINAGLHVHHDISDINDLNVNYEDILKTYLPFQETLYSLVEESRVDNTYCVKIDPDNLESGRNIRAGTSGIIFSKFGTLEFRMKEGITDTKEILRWIIYTQKVVDAMYLKLSKKIKKQQEHLNNLTEASIFMVLDTMGTYNIGQKVKNIRKLVGFQEGLYAKI